MLQAAPNWQLPSTGALCWWTESTENVCKKIARTPLSKKLAPRRTCCALNSLLCNFTQQNRFINVWHICYFRVWLWKINHSFLSLRSAKAKQRIRVSALISIDHFIRLCKNQMNSRINHCTTEQKPALLGSKADPSVFVHSIFIRCSWPYFSRLSLFTRQKLPRSHPPPRPRVHFSSAANFSGSFCSKTLDSASPLFHKIMAALKEPA